MPTTIPSHTPGKDVLVDARSLHAALGIRTGFNTWIRRAVKAHGAEEKRDYWPFLDPQPKGRPSTEFHLTLALASLIAMKVKEPVGPQAAKWFSELKPAAPVEVLPAEGLLPTTFQTEFTAADIDKLLRPALIPPDENHGEIRADARIMHTRLEIKSHFDAWIKAMIDEAQLVEGKDYWVSPIFMENPKGGRPRIDYYLSRRAIDLVFMKIRGPLGRVICDWFADRADEYHMRQPVCELSDQPSVEE